VSLGFFFVQVKGTTVKSAADARLPVEVSLHRFNRLVRVPSPTFVIGVDVLEEVSFLVSAHTTRTADVSSITKAYSLQDDEVRIKLYQEVLEFWRTNRPFLHRTHFKDV